MTDIVPPGPPRAGYRAFLAAYDAAMAAAEPLVWRYFRRRAVRDPAYLERPEERRGAGAAFDADLWVHAVSLGEMRSAAPLVRLALDRGWRVVTTHATPAGRRAAEDGFGEAIAAGRMAVRYAPIDRRRYWRRFLAVTKPRAALVMEIEFWPGMIEAAAEAGVALILANSQVPGRTFPRARRLGGIVGHPVARAAAVFAKSRRMAARFEALGARRVAAMGETRFDIRPPEAHVTAGRALAEAWRARRIVTFASVVAGEEETCLAALRTLLAQDEGTRAIWVPRAPESFESTAARLAGAGLRVARRSEAFDGALAPVGFDPAAQVLLGDSMGEMFFYLAPADVVVVGGGFIEKGAHNVIEPLALAKPVVTGPHIWTIEFPGEEAREAGVLTVVPEGGDLAEAIRRAAGRDGARARDFHARMSGASARIVERIAPLVEGGA